MSYFPTNKRMKIANVKKLKKKSHIGYTTSIVKKYNACNSLIKSWVQNI